MRNRTRHERMKIADNIRVHQRPEHVTASVGSGMPSSPVLLGPLQRRGATKFALRRKLLVAIVSILSSMSVAMAGPSPNLHKRHPPHAGEVETVGRPQSFEPPRMIEVRPGWWISTYDCVTDEGQGRWRPCSAGGA